MVPTCCSSVLLQQRLFTLTKEATTLLNHRARFDGRVLRPIMTLEASTSRDPSACPEAQEAFFRSIIVSLACVLAQSLCQGSTSWQPTMPFDKSS